MAEADKEALEAIFNQRYSKLTVKQQIYFNERCRRRLTSITAYKLAYDCSNMNEKTIKRKANIEENKGTFRATKEAFDALKGYGKDHMLDETIKMLFAKVKTGLDDVTYKDPASGKSKQRPLDAFSDQAKIAATIEISQKQGLTLKF